MQKGWKKRRLQGACDTCRRKKIRCDSATMPDNQCSNCLAFNVPCKHSEPTKKRGPKSPYVENLEKRLKSMEELIQKFSPDFNLEEFGNQQSESLVKELSPLTSTIRPTNVPSSGQRQAASLPSLDQGEEEEEEDDFSHIEVARHMKKLSLKVEEDNFFGPSSSFRLVHNAHNQKLDFTGRPFDALQFKRPVFWEPQPWELLALSSDKAAYVFPENDLLVSLISLYFSQVNSYLPLVHAPTFKRNICEGLHYRDHKFGGMVLAMCALASRYSDDPRVFEDPQILTSAGWKYFKQVKTLSGMTIDMPTLYDLQTFCLATFYLSGSSFPQASWALIGIAIRFAEELGYHRRKPDGVKLTPEIEQQKRVFWVLVSMDRMISNFTGRPSAIREEDYDQDMPVDCDDEYWENTDPSLEFKQPPNKPSSVSCFICQIKLCEILGFALRTLFPTKKSKTILGLVGNDWEQKVISELDSSLNNWINNIPDHLRWNTKQENTLFFNQSAFLHATYYNVQIQVHRPFIQKPSALMFPSLAICTNAARSCINVLHRHSESKRGVLALPHIFFAGFAAGVILLTNIWSSKRTGIKFDQKRELADVAKAMGVMTRLETRWVGAGKFTDIICELARGLDGTDPCEVQNSQTPTMNGTTPCAAKGSRDSSSYVAQPVTQPVTPDSDSNSERRVSTDSPPSIPFSSEELGTRPFGLDLPGFGGMPTDSFPSINGNGIFPDNTMSNSVLNAGDIYSAAYLQPQSNDSDMATWWNTLGGQNVATMWTTAPTGFSVDEWAPYVEHMNSANPP